MTKKSMCLFIEIIFSVKRLNALWTLFMIQYFQDGKYEISYDLSVARVLIDSYSHDFAILSLTPQGLPTNTNKLISDFATFQQ